MRSWVKRLYGFFRLSSRPVQEPKNPKTYHQHNFAVNDLVHEAAKRQATIGKHYVRNRQTPELLSELQRGIVSLPPHESWRGDYTDWTADPFNDLNWRFQFHTLRWINPYLWDALDGNEASKIEWKRIVHSWVDANIPPERAEDKYAWMDMTDGNRALQISLGAPLMDNDDQWYIDCLATHRNWLLDDTNIVPGNHGLHQNLGLFVVSSVLGDKIGIEQAIRRLGAQILNAFDGEGLNDEGSVAYHQFNLVWWLQARKRLKLEGFDFPSESVERLEKAGEAMAYLLLPDKTMPQIGDGGRGKGRRGIHPLVNQVLNGKVHDHELPILRHFPNGITVSRSGWGQTRPLLQESHTIVRHGVDLQRHSHNDRGSVHIYTLGRRWITDGGFHSYQRRNRDRNYTKSRAAHSLIHLPEQRYDNTGDVPVQLLQHEDHLHAIEILDENFESAQWLRRVVYIPNLNCWVVWDRVRTDKPQDIRQQWLIDIGIKVSQHDTTTLHLTDNTSHVRMQWLGELPKFDIVTGNRKSNSKRGLIGTRWKSMNNGTSVHANFLAKRAEFITVISTTRDEDMDVILKQRSNMKSFTLLIRSSKGTYELIANLNSTRLTKEQTKH